MGELEAIKILNDRVTPEVLKELWRVVVAELNTGLRRGNSWLSIDPGFVKRLMDGGLYYHQTVSLSIPQRYRHCVIPNPPL
ncbi:hypothetical protein W02_17870 [Nitrospira sp. KM1]|nr:hypothetical protein W02_17870 [Nitrospira sp. KM1]